MATIKERAKKYAISISPYPQDKGATWDVDTEKGYIAGATEQDRISRAEERERCIEAAINAHCKCCGVNEYCRVFNPMIIGNTYPCDEREQIRKAIEKGGEG